MTAKGLMTVAEVAKYLDVSRYTVYKYLERGVLSKYKNSMNKLRLNAEEVQEFKRGRDTFEKVS